MSAVLVNISCAGAAPFPALLHRDRAVALTYWQHTSLAGVGSMAGLLEQWPAHAPTLKRLAASAEALDTIASQGVKLEDMTIHAPVHRGQVYCTIGNYRAQVLEAALDADDGQDGARTASRKTATLAAIAKRRDSGSPYVCMKGSACIAGPHDPLHVGADLATLDWEVEVGVIIGRTAWKVDRAAALDYVAGYCVVNDITLRSKVFRTDPQIMGTDWLQSKARPGWLPTGPWLVPAWDVPDPAALHLQLKLNGTIMQDGFASDMIFDIAEQIAYLSQHTRLEPGDLLCTGSPAGFGSHHGRYLRAGDIMEAGIGGLGTQRVVCVP